MKRPCYRSVVARKVLKVYFFPTARPSSDGESGSCRSWFGQWSRMGPTTFAGCQKVVAPSAGHPGIAGSPTIAVTTKSRLTGGLSIAILRTPGCSALRWILGVGPHPHESRKTRHTVVFCILFICDASSSRSRTPRWHRAIPAGQRPTSRADVPHLGDLPSSQIMISGNDRRLLDNLRKPGLLALLRDFWNRGTADRRHEGGHGSW